MLTHSPASSPCLTRRSIFAREKMDPRVEPAGDRATESSGSGRTVAAGNSNPPAPSILIWIPHPVVAVRTPDVSGPGIESIRFVGRENSWRISRSGRPRAVASCLVKEMPRAPYYASGSSRSTFGMTQCPNFCSTCCRMASLDDPAILRLVYAQARRTPSIVYGSPSLHQLPEREISGDRLKCNQRALRR
jgi:hypothetical protein